ncbi:MAG: HDOD domain-containing protein [Verrucomicrobia bacterium]|nr:HDOD domain-containing protein [Verrucomicrobiota bacterium]
MQRLDDYINAARHLPPAPHILPQLLELLEKEDADSDEIVELITYDPALTFGVLRLCNSAYLGAALPACDIQEAVTRLGFKPVFQLVAAVCGGKTLAPPQEGYSIEPGELWRHSVATAVCAQLIAKECHINENLAFTAGLLHDIGKIILSEFMEASLPEVLNTAKNSRLSFPESEKAVLGVDHAEIGGRLLAGWRFPPEIIEAVEHHHNPSAAIEHKKLAACICLSNTITHCMGLGCGLHAFATGGQEESIAILKTCPDTPQTLMLGTFRKLELVETLFTQALR